MFSDLIRVYTGFMFWMYVDTIHFFPGVNFINSALIHSCLSAIHSNYMIFYYPIIFTDLMYFKVISPIHMDDILLLSFSYSYYDLYLSIQNRKIDEMIHGFMFASVFTYLYYYNSFYIMYIALLCESSSIFLNLRPLKKIWIDIMFIFTFLMYRLIIVPTIIYYYSSNPENPHITFINTQVFIMTLLNLYWFRLIIKKAIKKLSLFINTRPHTD